MIQEIIEMWIAYSDDVKKENRLIRERNSRTRSKFLEGTCVKRKFLWWSWEEQRHPMYIPPGVPEIELTFGNFMEFVVEVGDFDINQFTSMEKKDILHALDYCSHRQKVHDKFHMVPEGRLQALRDKFRK